MSSVIGRSGPRLPRGAGWRCWPAGLALLWLLAASAAAARVPSLRARAAHTVSVKDEGHLHLTRSSGSTIYDEGSAHGTLPGSAKVRFFYDGNPNVSAQITIYTHGGTIDGHGSARLSNPSSASPSFAGSLTITGGSGRYLHVRGSGRLYGVFYRRSYALVVQTQGTLSY